MIHAPDSSILDHLLEGCQIIGPDFRYLYLNEAAAKDGRKSKEELLGHTMMEMYPGIVATPMFASLRQCMSRRESAELENEFTYADGTTGWFVLRVQPVPQGLFILSMDISERKRAEMDLQSQLQRLEALREIDIAIVSTTDLTSALKTILEKVTSHLHVNAADILLLNPHTYELEFAAARGFYGRGIEQTRVRIGQGHAGRAALEQKTVAIADLQLTQAFMRASLVAGEEFVSAYFVPLVSKENVLGVLEVFHRKPLYPDRAWLDFLETLAGQASIAIDNGHLFQNLQRSNLDLALAYESTIEGWSRALDLRDRETEGHTLRVTEMTIAVARAAGLTEHEIVHVKRGASLHDIGKMGVPDSILLKPGKLTDQEWEVMRRHPVFAYDLLYPIEYLRPSLTIPYYHHEKWDGSGYPQGLQGEQIPLPARLFAVVDVWDALSHDRPYRAAWTQQETMDYLRAQSGTHFDPKAVELFFHVLHSGPRPAGAADGT